MKSRILTLVATLPLRAESAPPPPAELKLFDQFKGTWRYEVTVHKSE